MVKIDGNWMAALRDGGFAGKSYHKKKYKKYYSKIQEMILGSAADHLKKNTLVTAIF